MMEWLKSLIRPAPPKAAAALAEHLREASWWTMHKTISPMAKLSPEAEVIRTAFLGPFLAIVASFNSFADGTTRAQTRTFWEIVKGQDEDFWLAIPPEEITFWPGGSWNAIRDILFGIHVDRKEKSHESFTDYDSYSEKCVPNNGNGTPAPVAQPRNTSRNGRMG